MFIKEGSISFQLLNDFHTEILYTRKIQGQKSRNIFAFLKNRAKKTKKKNAVMIQRKI